MSAQLRSELFKQRTTRTSFAVLFAMIGLIAAVVLLHAVSLPVAEFTGRDTQLKVFGLGTTFGMLFASLIGALSITGEIRHGLIRPTFLATPNRARVITAKLAASALAGAAFGLLAMALAIAVGCAGLLVRAIAIAPSAGDFAQLLAGGAVAGAAWATIGVAVGALVRNQVAVVVGLAVWILFIEQTLIGAIPSAAKYAPGPSAGSLAGATLDQTSTYLLAPALGRLMPAHAGQAARGPRGEGSAPEIGRRGSRGRCVRRELAVAGGGRATGPPRLPSRRAFRQQKVAVRRRDPTSSRRRLRPSSHGTPVTRPVAARVQREWQRQPPAIPLDSPKRGPLGNERLTASAGLVLLSGSPRSARRSSRSGR